jgi:hypothetical protein
MSTRPNSHPSIEVLEGVCAVLVGGGIVTMALFPLALPIIALTLVAAIPLVFITLAAALAVAAVIVPILLVLVLSPDRPRSGAHPDRAHSSESRLRGPAAA